MSIAPHAELRSRAKPSTKRCLERADYGSRRRLRDVVLSACIAFAAGCSPNAPNAAATLLVGGSTALEPVMREAALVVAQRKGFAVESKGGGSMIGLATAREGGVGTLSRKLTPQERASGLTSVTVGADAIALIVHPDNQVRSLSRESVAAAFSGRVRMWRELGGNADTIALYGMARQFGTYEEFVRQLNLDGVVAGGFQGYPWPEKILRLVTENPGALAFLPLGNLLDLDPTLSTVHLLAVDGVLPTDADKSLESYALIRPLELVTLGPPAGTAKHFIDFMISSDGQALLATHHFVQSTDTMPVGARPPSVPPDTDR